MINRSKVLELVRLFYLPTCKTFYVNSIDGISFVKPLGVFVSLGMTTSIRTLVNIKNLLNRDKTYKVELAELTSINSNGQFINTIINAVNPTQYKLKEGDYPEGVMNKVEVDKELEFLKTKLSPHSPLDDITEYSPRFNKLQRLADKLNESEGWDSHLIQKVGESDYRIFHLYINYKKEYGVEHRLGILVTEEPSDKSN